MWSGVKWKENENEKKREIGRMWNFFLIIWQISKQILVNINKRIFPLDKYDLTRLKTEMFCNLTSFSVSKKSVNSKNYF